MFNNLKRIGQNVCFLVTKYLKSFFYRKFTSLRMIFLSQSTSIKRIAKMTGNITQHASQQVLFVCKPFPQSFSFQSDTSFPIIRYLAHLRPKLAQFHPQTSPLSSSNPPPSPPPTTPSGMSSWSCSTCAFMNNDLIPVCLICSTPRSTFSPPAKRQKVRYGSVGKSPSLSTVFATRKRSGTVNQHLTPAS